MTNLTHLNNLNITIDMPKTNQPSDLYMDYNNHFFILYRLITFLAVIIIITIIFKIKKHICIDRNLDNKVVRLTRNSELNNDIPQHAKSESKKKRKKPHSSI